MSCEKKTVGFLDIYLWNEYEIWDTHSGEDVDVSFLGCNCMLQPRRPTQKEEG